MKTELSDVTSGSPDELASDELESVGAVASEPLEPSNEVDSGELESAVTVVSDSSGELASEDSESSAGAVESADSESDEGVVVTNVDVVATTPVLCGAVVVVGTTTSVGGFVLLVASVVDG